MGLLEVHVLFLPLPWSHRPRLLQSMVVLIMMDKKEIKINIDYYIFKKKSNKANAILESYKHGRIL